MIVKAAWVLSVILAAESKGQRLEAFDAVAENVAREASASPLFKGELGAHETAALLVGWYHFESHNDPLAVGDCGPKHTTKQGTCVPGAGGNSFGLGQTNRSNFKALGIEDAQAYLRDVPRQVQVSLAMMHRSFATCRTRPVEERGIWYAVGGDGCVDEHHESDRAKALEEGARKSKHRIAYGRWLFEKHRAIIEP